jgi:hypothetical protein
MRLARQSAALTFEQRSSVAPTGAAFYGVAHFFGPRTVKIFRASRVLCVLRLFAIAASRCSNRFRSTSKANTKPLRNPGRDRPSPNLRRRKHGGVVPTEADIGAR